MPEQGLADVLHHALPSFYVEAFDRTGVATAIGSFSDLATSMGDCAFTRDLARHCNDFLAQLAADHLWGLALFHYPASRTPLPGTTPYRPTWSRGSTTLKYGAH